jgi:arylsulfatase A-like enzyme
VTLLGTPLAADKPTLAKRLKKAGYQTAVFGKRYPRYADGVTPVLAMPESHVPDGTRAG